MKIEFNMTKEMRGGMHLSVSEFGNILRHFELEDQFELPQFQEKAKIYLQNLTLFSPNQIIS